MNYILAKMKVKEVMQKEVITIDPEASIEQALAQGLNMKVGIMPVMEGSKVVGVLTTTDFMLKVLNQALGIGKPGTRINIEKCNQAKAIGELMELVEKNNLKILSAHTMPPAEETPAGFSLHVESEDVKGLIKDIEGKGYKVSIVAR
jgi:acetoin utilization protein AcuB